jgi:pSer/pThr/pTyr-binding forkhead associated (FHA) protein
MPGQDIIRVGRKRREVGMPADEGNDFVLRVAGNDPLSARISRQHFEVRRSGDGWAAVDISKAGTRLNGKPLTKGVPTPLQPGDKLVVADVISLEVLFTQDVTGAIATTAHVPASALTAGQTGQVVAETSVGDLITVE